MIYSDKQNTLSKTTVASLQEALRAVEASERQESWLKKAEADALKSQIADLESEIFEYELLKSGQITFSKSYALESLPEILVQARIAAGQTQTDLAARLGMKPQQVQRYEATNYMGASLATLVEVSRALGVKSSGTFESAKAVANSIFLWNDVDDIVWGELPYREMMKRRWFDVPRGANPLDKVKEYFLRAAGPQFATAYHRKKMRSGNVPNEYALIAWQARVLDLARNETEGSDFGTLDLNEKWLPELVNLTRRQDGARRARQFLAKRGIALVMERHLPGSYLDGAAMLSEAGRPIIGLTLRYDRLDNFWFVLFHELGHVFRHLLEGLRYDFFDEESAPDQDPLEVEADTFAVETLIREELWNQCLSRFALSEEAVNLDAEKLGIAPSIIAGRIRKERGDYTILNDLVGQNQVRALFETESAQ